MRIVHNYNLRYHIKKRIVHFLSQSLINWLW